MKKSFRASLKFQVVLPAVLLLSGSLVAWHLHWGTTPESADQLLKEAQRALLEELTRRGFDCRALTS